MPFLQASYFKPEELDALTAAFNETLQELRASSIDSTDEDKVALVTRKLAQRILVSAKAGGVRDVETLKEQALRSLSLAGVRPGGEQTFAKGEDCSSFNPRDSRSQTSACRSAS